MGDEDVSEVELLLQVGEQVDHLRLDRDVEGRDGLVRDHELRPQRQSPSVSPRRTSSETSSTACTRATSRWIRTPRLIGKYLKTCSASSSGPSACGLTRSPPAQDESSYRAGRVCPRPRGGRHRDAR